MSYTIAYTVSAFTELDAIKKAVALLRTGVELRGVGQVSKTEGPGPIVWTVCLNVWEDA